MFNWIKKIFKNQKNKVINSNVNHSNCVSDVNLLVAASNGNLEIVKALLANNNNVNNSNWFGDNALLLATNNGHLPIVTVLLVHNVNANASNNVGNSALSWLLKKVI